MNDDQNWAEALNINPENLAEWSAQAPAGKPLLVYCLEQGFVSAQEYFSWAQARFGLPLLDDAFFQNGINTQLVEEAKIQGRWLAWCFPVENWDGITIVACVELPEEPDFTKFRYVLAHPTAMRDAWGITVTSIRPPSIPQPTPAPAASLGDGPMGLATVPKPFKLSLDEAPPAEEDTEPDALTEGEGVPISNILASTVTVPKNIPPLPAAPPAPPTPPAASGMPPTPPAPKQKPSLIATDSKTNDQAIDEMMKSLAERYKGVMVLRCTEGIARPYLWSETLTVPNAEAAKVNLSYPTFLRIVSKTNMPYHGYLVESPAHTEFFAAIGQKTLPACVTAVPIKIDGQLWAIVVGIGGDENQKMESLIFMQEQVDDCVQAFSEKLSKAS